MNTIILDTPDTEIKPGCLVIQQGGRAHGEICLVTRQDGKLSVLYLDDGALLPLEPDSDVTYELLPIGSKVTLTPKE